MPSAIAMRLEYNGDKTHVIMEAYAEHDYSFKLPSIRQKGPVDLF